MVTAEVFRRLALSFPGAVEGMHQGKPDFRVGERVFATLGYPDADWGMVKVSVGDQALLVAGDPGIFRPVTGKWGQRGSTNVRLAAVTEMRLHNALEMAWQHRAPRRLLRTYAVRI